MNRIYNWMVAGVVGVGVAGYAAGADKPAAKDAAADKAAPAKKTAMVHIKGAGEHKVTGHLTLTEVEGGVKAAGEISGLTPGDHGFHVHEKGDLSDPKLAGAGGHFNPGKGKHGGPDAHDRHAGDWGNITADAKGVAKVDGVFKGLTLAGEKDGIMGRSVIVHAKADDLKTDPSGNSGDRIAGGVIEADKHGEKK